MSEGTGKTNDELLTPSPLEGGSAAAASRSRKGERPCGECHLKEGEICDICGARRPVDASVNADLIAMMLAEECSIEDGRISNVPYVAVKIAEAIERSRLQPAAASRSREVEALETIRDWATHTRNREYDISDAMDRLDIVRSLADEVLRSRLQPAAAAEPPGGEGVTNKLEG